jgi:uncharacterized protein
VLHLIFRKHFHQKIGILPKRILRYIDFIAIFFLIRIIACIKFFAMNATTNSLNWFEIPVTDLQRAKHFYQVAFGIHMEEMNMPGMEMAVFPMEMGNGKASGALVKSDFSQPSKEGVLIYLNANPDMTDVLERIKSEGGEIVMDKTLISPEIGYMANFIDTEGNRIALHSQQ